MTGTKIYIVPSIYVLLHHSTAIATQILARDPQQRHSEDFERPFSNMHFLIFKNSKISKKSK